MRAAASVVVVCATLSLSGCGQQSTESAIVADEQVSLEAAAEAIDAAPAVIEAEDDEMESAYDAIADTAYSDTMLSALCTEDCSGHEAGYDWAQQNQIAAADDCGGNSASFSEGCQAYVAALAEQLEQ